MSSEVISEPFPVSLSADAAHEPNTDAALLAASRRGDRAAFGELVRRHERHVFRLAGRVLRDAAEVEDVAQETFLRAWARLESYRGDAPFEHWLTRICLRVSYDCLRRRPDRETTLAVDPPAPRPDPDARLEVEALLAELSPADRMVLLLLDGEGWSVGEIAARLGWTAVNVKVRAHRARRRLRRRLEEG